MLRRYLDVCRQYRRLLLLAALLVPMLALGSRALLDQSAVVTARLWVQPPSFMLDPSVYGGFLGTPPQTEATLMVGQVHQWVGTDAFVDRVLVGAQPGYADASEAEKSVLRHELRNSFRLTVERARFLLLEYRTDQPERGVAVLTSLIREVGKSAPLVHFESTAGEGVAGAELRAARSAVGQAFTRLALKGSVDAKPERAAPISTRLNTLLRAAESTRIQYRRELDRLTGPGRADPGSADAPQLQQAVFHVIDPPMAKAESTDSAVTLFVVALAGTAAAEFMIVYLIGLHDPRVRSGADVERRTGIPYVGSTGMLRPRTG
jgi:hypothetical protein